MRRLSGESSFRRSAVRGVSLYLVEIVRYAAAIYGYLGTQ